MKYELTQGQYTDFLNTISATQVINRYPASKGNQMHDIGIDNNTKEYFTNSKDRACNFLSVNDLFSYLDWAALRPMTELEFEKVCRGPIKSAQGEWAWGQSKPTEIIEAISLNGTTSGNEICSELNANAHYKGSSQNINGPLAGGIFARDTTRSRFSTGAGFYGVMELSGNLWERCIQINSNGTTPSAYDGIWGDGQLTNAGIYDTPNWSATGNIIDKGGSFSDAEIKLRVSDRTNFNNTNYATRAGNYGGRGVR